MDNTDDRFSFVAPHHFSGQFCDLFTLTSVCCSHCENYFKIFVYPCSCVSFFVIQWQRGDFNPNQQKKAHTDKKLKYGHAIMGTRQWINNIRNKWPNGKRVFFPFRLLSCTCRPFISRTRDPNGSQASNTCTDCSWCCWIVCAHPTNYTNHLDLLSTLFNKWWRQQRPSVSRPAWKSYDCRLQSKTQ